MKKHILQVLYYGKIILLFLLSTDCTERQNPESKIHIIFDTDANNELDDQHALAYLLFSGNEFNLKGITVNSTYNGGNISGHYAEAERVLQLCNLYNKVPLLKGANENLEHIEAKLDSSKFDGFEAVNFIIEQAKLHYHNKLVIIAVGKLTNVALAIKKQPSISRNIRLVWLGSNYPEAGEYNLENDIPAMNFLLKSDIHFEMVVCRYGKQSGTDAVRVTKNEILTKMAGLGPKIKYPVTGRHGDSFYTFGDYSVNLFEHIQYYGKPQSRALFDMAAVAIVKNPEWAALSKIPCPIMVNEEWIEQPDNKRKIYIWENFDKESILNDFYLTIKNYVLVE